MITQNLGPRWKKTKVSKQTKFKKNNNLLLIIMMFKKVFYICMVKKIFTSLASQDQLASAIDLTIESER